MITLPSRKALLGMFFVCAGLLTSCAKYKPQPLQAAQGFPQVKNDVTVNVHPLSEADCKFYFSRKIVAKGYQPLHVAVTNTSSKPYILDSYNIGLPLENSHNVAKACHLHTAKRIVSWCIPALFFWPFVIPAAVDGAKSSSANKLLTLDFSERAISSDARVIIPAHSTINKVMFVRRENFKHNFDIALTERDNAANTLAFRITV